MQQWRLRERPGFRGWFWRTLGYLRNDPQTARRGWDFYRKLPSGRLERLR